MTRKLTSTVKKSELYEPDSQARVELVNGRILDVVHGRYHDAGTRLVLQGGKIAAMPGPVALPVRKWPGGFRANLHYPLGVDVFFSGRLFRSSYSLSLAHLEP